MVRDKNVGENDKWVTYCNLMMQQLWKKEIEEAIEKVKQDSGAEKYQKGSRRKKWGY